MQECKTEGDRLAWLVEEHIQPLYALAGAMSNLWLRLGKCATFPPRICTTS